MKLYDHQQKIIDENKPKTGLFLGTGSGKTLIALLLARGRTLVICPKTQKEDRNWERENEEKKLGVDLTVISKEKFRATASTLDRFDTVIVDEADTCLGVTPSVKFVKKQMMPRASQLFEELEKFLERTQPDRFYPVTATIVRSPMTVWAAGKLLGKEWDFFAWRSTFYVKLPMPGREVWQAKTDSATKERLADAVRKIGYVGRLQDFFDVPEQTFKTFHVDLTDAQKKRIKELPMEYPEPVVLVGKKHQVENGTLGATEFQESEIFESSKIDKLLDLAIEFPRMVVFAKYTNQIAQIREKMTKEGHKVLVLDGSTKDRRSLFLEAITGPGCIFIAQSSISAGWQLPTFPVMVFASMTYSLSDRIQGEGRILRSDNLKKNLYIDLFVKGGVDEAVYDSIINKKDFDERIYAKKT